MMECKGLAELQLSFMMENKRKILVGKCTC